MAGGSNPSLASDHWYRDATAAASAPGELRLVMNLESLVKSEPFARIGCSGTSRRSARFGPELPTSNEPPAR
jgi:hypothetical protein